MTIQEITRLRKDGHIAEALAAAEDEYDRNGNIYTGKALFWCLNDTVKQQSGDDARDTCQRMEALYNDYGSNDEYMTRSIETIRMRLLNHSSELKQAIASAKEGRDVTDVCSKLYTCYCDGDLDDRLLDEFGWLLYYALRNTKTADRRNFKLLLYWYLKIGHKSPSALHSMILKEAVRLKRDAPDAIRIRDFVSLWGIDNLRDDDWQQFKTNDGNTLPSLVESLVGVYAKEIKTDAAVPSDGFCTLLDKALSRYPKNQNMPYFKATVLMLQGRYDEAVEYYKRLIIKTPSKSYLWDHAAALVNDADISIALLCKAVNTGEDEAFLGKIRIRLADAFVNKGLTPNAKRELETYRQTYEKRGWRIGNEYWDVYNRLGACAAAPDNNTVYAEYSSMADAFIYEALSSVFAVKVAGKNIDDRRHPGKKLMQWTLKSDQKVLLLKKPRKYGLDNRTPDGTVFEAKVIDGKIVWIAKAQSMPTLAWLRCVSGKVTLRDDRNGHKYAIVKKVYVGQSLLAKVVDGDVITVVALRQADGRWSAVGRL